MPDLKISQLSAASTPLTGAELVPIVQSGNTVRTTVSAFLTSTLSSGIANGVLFLNGSKAVTTGSGLTFDGTNLGIGTSSPGAKLQVGDAGSAAPVKILIRTAPADTYLQSTTTGSVFGTPNNVPLLFNTNDAEKMRLDASGNLGLGVTPSAWGGSGVKGLQIASAGALLGSGGSMEVRYNSYYNGTNDIYTTSQTAFKYVQQFNLGHAWYTSPSGTAGDAISFTQAMTLDASGNLGVGVTPSAWGGSYKAFENAAGFYGSFSTNVLIMGQNWYDSGAGSYLYRATGFASYYSQANGEHRFYNAPSGTAGNAISFTQAMTLDADGDLGIGTNSPDAKLDVVVSAGLAAIFGSESASNSYVGFKYNGTTLGYVGNGAGVAVGSATTEFSIGSTGARALTFGTNDTERMRITSTGNIVAGASAALATTATDGFIYVPTCAGTPTGTPTAITGMAPIVVNTTNNKLYFYSGGAWRDAGP